MEDIIKHAIGAICAILIMCCLKRQYRYWRELQENRPSGSIRAGYQLSILMTVAFLMVSLVTRSDWMWELFKSVLLLALGFCVKITFSPSAVALTLTMCVYRLYYFDEFPLLEVWASFTHVITWRLPEDIRAAYTCASFLWILAATCSSPSSGEPFGESAVDNVGDTINSLHA